MMLAPDLLAIIEQYRYLIIFPLAMLEGPIVTVLVGYLVAQGKFEFFPAYVVLIAGDLSGDSLYYWLGRLAHHPNIVGVRNWFGLNNERIAWIAQRFERVNGRAILLGKILHGLGGAVLVAAGLTNMLFWKFFWYNVIGTLPKTLIFMLLGFFFGAAYETINHYLKLGAGTGLIVLIGIVVATVIVLQFSSKKHKPN